MKDFNVASLRFLIFVYIIFVHLYSHANSKCILPTPDGNENASNRSLAGVIKSVNQVTIIISEYPNGNSKLLKLNKRLKVYTAFGGGDDISILKSGQFFRIWFENCRKTLNAKIAYFEIFSTDPSDKPHSSYLSDPGQ